MSPIDKARQVYSQEPCARTFDEDLRLHLKFGYVFSTPEFFIMGRPVDSTAEYHLVTDPSLQFPEPDAWLVYLAAGDLSMFWTIKPFDLPYIGWERDNALRFYPSERLEKICDRVSSSTVLGVPTSTGAMFSIGN